MCYLLCVWNALPSWRARAVYVRVDNNTRYYHYILLRAHGGKKRHATIAPAETLDSAYDNNNYNSTRVCRILCSQKTFQTLRARENRKLGEKSRADHVSENVTRPRTALGTIIVHGSRGCWGEHLYQIFLNTSVYVSRSGEYFLKEVIYNISVYLLASRGLPSNYSGPTRHRRRAV